MVRIFGKIFISIILFLALFIIAEAITSRIKENDKFSFDGFNSPQTRKIKPYVMFGGAPNGTVQLIPNERLNALGYRGELPEKLKKLGEYRIFILGGSTVMLGAPALPQLLQNIFNKNGFTSVKVFNFGSISSETGQSLARILYEIYDYQPNFIVMYEGGNDIMDRFLFDPRPGYPYNFIVYEKNPLLAANNYSEYPILSLIALKSVFARSIAQEAIMKDILKLDKLQKEVSFNSENWKMDVINSYFKNIQKGEVLSKSLGAGFLGIFQPLLCTKKHFTAEEKKHLSEKSEQYCIDMVKRFRKEIINLQNNDNSIIDYSDMFDESRDWIYIDYIHFRNSNINSMIAERLYKDIVKNAQIVKH